MNRFAAFAVLPIAFGLAVACRQSSETKPELRVTATIPSGWRPIENAVEPPEMILLGAWEHPDFKSIIKVKLTSAYGTDAARFAEEAVATRVAQGYVVTNIETDVRDGVHLWFEIFRPDGSLAAKSRMVFYPVGSKLLVVIGLWDAEHDQLGRDGFAATLAGIRVE